MDGVQVVQVILEHDLGALGNVNWPEQTYSTKLAIVMKHCPTGLGSACSSWSVHTLLACLKDTLARLADILPKPVLPTSEVALTGAVRSAMDQLGTNYCYCCYRHRDPG